MSSHLATAVADYLYYSYLPDSDTNLPAPIRRATATGTHDDSLYELLSTGAEKWKRAVDRLVREHSPDAHIVPLSSGWDSRFILGALLSHDNVSADSIHACTFGIPGSWDYDIGQWIARSEGVSHTPIDLQDIEWSRDALASYAESCRNPTRFFEGYCVRYTLDRVATADSLVWSGFLGDPLSGNHVPSTFADDWKGAQQHFAETNKTTDLAPDGYDPLAPLPDEPFVDPDFISYEEQLDIAVRQLCFNQDINEPTGWTYARPFLDEQWASFLLRLPDDLRRGRQYYRQLLHYLYPRLYEYPTESTYGLRPSAPMWQRQASRFYHQLRYRTYRRISDRAFHPSENHLNFRTAIRNGKLRDIVGGLVAESLSCPAFSHLDIDAIWREHQRGADRNHELRTLANVQIANETEII